MQKSLGVWGGVAIAASSTAATSSIGIGLGLIAGMVGLHLPALMLLAFLPILGIAGGYGRLSRVEPNAGSSYHWVGRTLSPWLGFLSGWVNVVGLGLDPDSTLQALRAVVGPLLGAVTLLAVGGYPAWVFYDSADHFELSADNGWFTLLIPALMLASGLAVAAWARWVRKAPYFSRRFGTSPYSD